MDRAVAWSGVRVAIAIALAPFALTSNADVSGSGHDFSGYGWSGTRVCVACHTPHGANDVADGPLWNHELTTATFTLYSSGSLDSVPGQPASVSLLCLSCHDGTVAVDSFGGSTGSFYVSGTRNIGIDISDDHPVGIDWDHQTSMPDCTVCHWDDPLPFFGAAGSKTMECATCHDPHDASGLPGLLRRSMANSELCFICHGK